MVKNTEWYRKVLAKLDADIKDAEASIERMKMHRVKVLRRLAPMAARDCVAEGRKFLGRWTVGSGLNSQATWDIMLMPDSFVIDENWGMAVWTTGTILWRRKEWKEGLWKPMHGETTPDGKKVSTMTVFEGTSPLYEFRKATREEIETALSIIAATGKKDDQYTP